MNELFFELIRVALGNADGLSHIPKPKEWQQLYDMAKKQSLVGICFAGVQRLGNASYENQNENENRLEPSEALETYWNLPEMLYLTWMGMAAKIQQRNEIVNKQCVGLCSLLGKEGIRSCILKGQGTAALYWVSRDARLAADARLEVRDGDGLEVLAEARVCSSRASRDARLEVSENPTPSPLTTNLNSPNQNSLTTTPSTLTYIGALRQSGDIDVWVMPKDVRTIKESRPRIDEMVQRRFPDEKGAFVHIGFPCYADTEVEMHYIPTMDGNPWVDRRFRRLFEESQDECFASTKLSTGSNVNELGFAVPEPMVNVLFNLHHVKRHFITSGIGLRHVIDLYFVLRDFETKTIKTPEAAASIAMCENSSDTSTSSAQRLDSSPTETSANVFNGSVASSGKKQEKPLLAEKRGETSIKGSGPAVDKNVEIRHWIRKLGMEKFFAGMLWVMQEVLFNSDSNSNENDNFVSKKNSNLSTLTSNLGIKPDERLGRFILQEIMQGGNFGHHDERQKDVGRMSFGKRWKAYMEVSMVRFRYFPMETLWSWMFRMKVGIWHRFGIEL